MFQGRDLNDKNAHFVTLIRKTAADGSVTPADDDWILANDDKCCNFKTQPYRLRRGSVKKDETNHLQFADETRLKLRSRDVYMIMYKRIDNANA